MYGDAGMVRPSRPAPAPPVRDPLADDEEPERPDRGRPDRPATTRRRPARTTVREDADLSWLQVPGPEAAR